MAFYVYILKCVDGSFYTGHTDDLERRINEHYSGISNCYTTDRRPVELVFSQDFNSRDDALLAERKIKKWTHREKEALVLKDWDGLLKLTSEENKIR